MLELCNRSLARMPWNLVKISLGGFGQLTSSFNLTWPISLSWVLIVALVVVLIWEAGCCLHPPCRRHVHVKYAINSLCLLTWSYYSIYLFPSFCVALPFPSLPSLSLWPTDSSRGRGRSLSPSAVWRTLPSHCWQPQPFRSHGCRRCAGLF